MACPFFCPRERMEDDASRKPFGIPLGALFRGECHGSNEPWTPEQHHLRTYCNFGYARGRCDRFPADAPADAVRFLITADHDSFIQVDYVFEKDYYPAGKGTLTVPGSGTGILHRQAEAYAAVYWERKQQ
jgi:hypothetical protein